MPPIITARLSSAESSTTDPGIHSLLKRRRINKRRHRRAGRPFRLQRAIVLIVLEIAAADERENSASLIIQCERRRPANIPAPAASRFGVSFAKFCGVFGVGLMIVTGMFFRLIEMRAQRFLRNFLQIGIDRRVNAKTLIHRAVPADRRDHLLANVINRVGLAPRALAVAGHDRFGLRARAFVRR